MSTKTRWPHAEAFALALEIQAALDPFCYKTVIAGSLRRNRPDVGDIELLFIPRTEMRQAGLFDLEPFDLANEELDRWLLAGTITKRPSVDGRFTYGPKNKLCIHSSGIPIDFFSTTIENWHVSLVIRTGGKATNLKLTNGAISKGAHLNAYGSGVTLQNQKIIPATSERHVFELCGVPYQEPEFRE